jgi:hypothetical protein
MDNNNTITRPCGTRYEYDSDFDVYRRVPEPEELTHMAQFGWVYACVFSIIIAVVATYSN